MNRLILNTEIQNFITDHIDSDITGLLLKGTSFPGIETSEIVAQIASKKRSQKKLPTWFQQYGIYYPNKLNIEQTSSEITAQHKASLVSGGSIIDLTGGFGVDAYYFSKRFKKVIHCEINAELSGMVQHNLQQLKVFNIETITTDGIEYLKQHQHRFDWIYIDPSRRDDNKGKVFFLKECLPDVTAALENLFEHADNIMIKTSPLLDISVGISDLKFVKTIHVVAVNNEVKELLWILEKNIQRDITIETINLKNETNETFSFQLVDEPFQEPNYSQPRSYLYEPNAAILKSGGFNSVASAFGMHKLHKHSHLYTSDILVKFPGRAFKIVKSILYNKKSLNDLQIEKANITTRNFPETIQNIRDRFKIKDGGSTYLFFTTTMQNAKCVLICTKTA